MFNSEKERKPTEQRFKKITVVYSDMGSSIGKFKKHRIYLNDVCGVKMSGRIDWVKMQINQAMKRKGPTGFVTNDYWFIRLFEHLSPENEFCIYHADVDVVVNEFVELNPNPTLDLGEYIFRLSVNKALKRK